MYIVLEGIVGAGKSTQVRKLVEYLRWQWKDVVMVREPGSTPIAEEIRSLAQAKQWQDEDMHPLTNAYLYAAARAQTIHTVVKPALESGKVVVSDRSFLSSLAYQGEAQWLGFETVLSVSREAIDGTLPDMIFYLDVDLDTALARTFDSEWDKWESQGRGFFESVKRGYEKCEKLEILKNTFIRVDANDTEDEVFQRIFQKLIIKNSY